MLGGCATVPAPKFTAETPVSQLKNWRMEGRIALRSGDEGWQAQLYWEHSDAQERLRLSGPLNQGMVSIILQKDLLYLNEGEGKITVAHDPDALLKERLGYTLPLMALSHWILGAADPQDTASAVSRNAAGQITSLTQGAWTLEFDQYQPSTGGYSLPHKLVANGHGIRLKWILDDWQTEPNTPP